MFQSHPPSSDGQAARLSEGILLIDKPKGITSFDVIRRLRAELGIRKMGHAGTLDPQASGLMIIGLGAATRQLTQLTKLDKTYIAEVLLGTKTESGDLEGRVVSEMDVSLEELDEQKIKEVVAGIVGTHDLQVPIYSAVKVGGRPLYAMARKGGKSADEAQIKAPVKEMKIYAADLLRSWQSGSKAVLEVELSVSSGTYIRTIGEEIGRRLGLPATLQNLRRTRIGQFNLKDALVQKLRPPFESEIHDGRTGHEDREEDDK